MALATVTVPAAVPGSDSIEQGDSVASRDEIVMPSPRGLEILHVLNELLDGEQDLSQPE